MNDDYSDPQHIAVSDIKAGDTVVQLFELRSKEVRKTRAGQDYLDLKLGDATGTISAKVWSDAIKKYGQDFNPGDFLKVAGRVDQYRDQTQIVVDKIRQVDLAEVPNPEMLLRSGKQDPAALLSELKKIASGLEPPQLAELVGEILERYSEDLKVAAAARMIHHAYRGGLVEHTVNVTRKVEAVARLEPEINQNIALAGAILHDIGKIRELDPGGTHRTFEGRLIGHLPLGIALIRETATDIGIVGAKWLSELEHIVLSHHGAPEFGSPIRPLTREAVLVHFIDNLDAKLKIMDEALESADSEGFSQYNKWLEGRAFVGTNALPEEENDAGN
jgi:3'-5' exoribonuclease